jgi:hypothetical protein
VRSDAPSPRGISATRLVAALGLLGFAIRSVSPGRVILAYRGRTTHVPRVGVISAERVRFLVGINGIRWEELQAALNALGSRPSGELPAVVVPGRRAPAK